MSDKKIVIANWKMSLGVVESEELGQKMSKKFTVFENGEVVLCPGFLSLQSVSKIIKDTDIFLGAQDVSWEKQGAFTGEVSFLNLAEVGCEYVIIGHSERRKYQLENYEIINKKVRAITESGHLTPIVCIGESSEERKAGKADYVLVEQLQQALNGINIHDNQQIIIAYEPIWAIGSGIAMKAEEAEYSHKIIRLTLNGMFGEKLVSSNFRIVYGGSVNSTNVKDFKNVNNIDGLLVGGASLNVDEFYKIAQAMLVK